MQKQSSKRMREFPIVLTPQGYQGQLAKVIQSDAVERRRKEVARLVAARNPSDPFVYGRVLSRLRSGLLEE